MQAIFLNDSSAANEKNGDSEETTTAAAAAAAVDEELSKDEQIAVLRSRIQQLEILSGDLRAELSAARAHLLNRNGMQSGLQTRISEQNSIILEMKSEELSVHLRCEKLSKERDEMSAEIERLSTQIAQLHASLPSEEQQRKLIAMQQSRAVVKQLPPINLKAHSNNTNNNNCGSCSSDEELAVGNSNESSIRDCFFKLRQQLVNSSPLCQHLLNNLESSVSSLLLTVTNKSTVKNNRNNNPASSSSSASSLTSSSGSSSLTSSSANSPVLQQQQQTAISDLIKEKNNSTEMIKTKEIGLIASESNVKKIISRYVLTIEDFDLALAFNTPKSRLRYFSKKV